MRRAATTVFLAGWIGFLAVSAAIPTLAVLRLAGAGFPSPSALAGPVDVLAALMLMRGNDEVFAGTCAALAALMIAAFLASALWMTLRTDDTDRAYGDRLAFAGLAGIGLLLAGARLSGTAATEAAGSLPSLFAVLCLSATAVLFDRMLDRQEEPEIDDEGLRMALSMIGREMARDAAARASVTEQERATCARS